MNHFENFNANKPEGDKKKNTNTSWPGIIRPGARQHDSVGESFLQTTENATKEHEIRRWKEMAEERNAGQDPDAEPVTWQEVAQEEALKMNTQVEEVSKKEGISMKDASKKLTGPGEAFDVNPPLIMETDEEDTSKDNPDAPPDYRKAA